MTTASRHHEPPRIHRERFPEWKPIPFQLKNQFLFLKKSSALTVSFRSLSPQRFTLIECYQFRIDDRISFLDL